MQQNCVTDVEHQSPRLSHSVTSSSSQYKGFLQSECVVCVCVCARARACEYLCSVMSDSVTQWTVACQVPMSMELSRQEYWSWLPFPSPGPPPDPGIKPASLETLVLAGGIIYQHPKRQNYLAAKFTASFRGT